MRSRWFGSCLYLFTMVCAPLAVWVAEPAAAVAQVRREPTSQMGRAITSKTDEVIAIAIKVGVAVLGFYLIFIAVKFASGQGREAFQHLMYFVLGAALLAGFDQVIAWSLG